jgi:uncharacterized protein YodC (DUF2158 family)
VSKGLMMDERGVMLRAVNVIAVGDTAILASGGPIMTVVEVAAGDERREAIAGCRWFDANGVSKQQAFPVSMLRELAPWQGPEGES